MRLTLSEQEEVFLNPKRVFFHPAVVEAEYKYTN